MPLIRFLPIDQKFEVSPGETVLDVAISNDVPLQHACGGFCACTTCHIKVIEGAENLSPMEPEEEERLNESADQVAPNSRLGCQTKIRGPVTVQIVNLD